MSETKKKETITDIVLEKLQMADVIEESAGENINTFQRELVADLRNEAKRLDTACNNQLSTSFGNTAAIRKALELCIEEMCKHCRSAARSDGTSPRPYINGCETLRVAKAALAEPVRNCDVGTVENQEERFFHYCLSNAQKGEAQDRCKKCPLKFPNISCEILWSQMPYHQVQY